MEKELLNASEAAEFLGCGKSTLWRWAAAGQAPAPIKLGGISRWQKSELQRLIEAASKTRGCQASSETRNSEV